MIAEGRCQSRRPAPNVKGSYAAKMPQGTNSSHRLTSLPAAYGRSRRRAVPWLFSTTTHGGRLGLWFACAGGMAQAGLIGWWSGSGVAFGPGKLPLSCAHGVPESCVVSVIPGRLDERCNDRTVEVIDPTSAAGTLMSSASVDAVTVGVLDRAGSGCSKCRQAGAVRQILYNADSATHSGTPGPRRYL